VSADTVAGEAVELFALPAPAAAKAGAVELATRRALDVAQLAPALEGLAELAIAAAKAVDVASRKADPYAIAAAGRELRETFAKLGIGAVAVPTAGAGDDLAGLLGGPELV